MTKRKYPLEHGSIYLPFKPSTFSMAEFVIIISEYGKIDVSSTDLCGAHTHFILVIGFTLLII